MMTSEPLTPERIEELRRMTPQEKFEIARQMYLDARRAKAGELHVQHPDWSEQQVYAEISRLFLIEAMNEG